MPTPRILIYKRTHRGDPDKFGRFGIEGCMGRVRNFPFDAVIGVGGISGWPVSQGIARKVNWVGRRPHRAANPKDERGDLVTFKRGDFLVLEDQGPLLASMSGVLAAAVYGTRNRFLFKSIRGRLASEAMRVIQELLDGDFRPGPSSGTGGGTGQSGCGPKKCRTVRPPKLKAQSGCRPRHC